VPFPFPFPVLLRVSTSLTFSSLADLKPSEFAIINTDNPDDFNIEDTLVLTDKQGLKLNLKIHYVFVSSLLPSRLVPSSELILFASPFTASTPIPAEPSRFRSIVLTSSSTRLVFLSRFARRLGSGNREMWLGRRVSQVRFPSLLLFRCSS